MKRIVSLAAAVALVTAFGLPAQAQTTERAPSSELKLTFTKDSTQYYSFSWGLKLKQSMLMAAMGGQPMKLGELSVDVTLTLTQKVTAVATDGTATVEATITSVQATSEQSSAMGMGSKGRYDSANPDGGTPTLKPLGLAIGKKLSFKIGPTGKVSDLTGGKAIQKEVQEAAAKALKAGGGGGGMGGMGGGMGGMGRGAGGIGMAVIGFADESLRSTLNVLHHVLPSKPKVKGETWTHVVTENLPPMGSMKFTGKYTHQGSVKGSTRISFKPEGDVKMEKSKADPNNPMAQLQKKLLKNQKVVKSSVKGLATIGKGKIVDSEVTQVIETTAEMGEMLKRMTGGQDAKLAIGYTLTLRYEQKSGPPAKKAPGKKTESDF